MTRSHTLTRKQAEHIGTIYVPNIWDAPPHVTGRAFMIDGRWVIVVSQAWMWRIEGKRKQRLDVEVKEPETIFEKATVMQRYRYIRDYYDRLRLTQKQVMKWLGPPPYPEIRG